jgi:hypothetical protein
MNCDSVVKQFSLLLYGELSFEDEETVQQHLDDCAACTTALAKTRALHQQVDAAEYAIPETLLQDARRNLRVAVSETPAVRRSAWDRVQFASWLSPRSWKWNIAGAMTLLSIGFFGGSWYSDAGPEPEPVHFAGSVLEPISSRVRFVQPEESGRVQIVLEEVRQRVLEGGVDDDHIRGLLLSAAREANDPGVRVETMDLLKDQSETKEVRRALLAALQHDTNPGVRLKALEGLRGNASDAETRRVLAQVLLKDENPGVRTQAIDLLTGQSEPDMVGVLQELVSREENNYVRLKCQKALREMNASVETF